MDINLGQLFVFLAEIGLEEGNSNYLNKIKSGKEKEQEHPDYLGLIGSWFYTSNSAGISTLMRLDSLDVIWNGVSRRVRSWSEQWDEFLSSLVDRETKFD